MSGIVAPVPGPGAFPGCPAVLVFPHAGGSPRQYASWSKLLSASDRPVGVLGVTYPGRDRRMADLCPDRVQDLAVEAADAVEAMEEPPAVLAGHSLGATVALETLLELHHRSCGAKLPTLVVSGQVTPEFAGGGHLHCASDEELLAELSRIGQSTAQVLADPEMAALHLPVIREDYRLIETYHASERPPSLMRTKIVTVRGTRDSGLASAELAGWHRWASRVTGPVAVPGDHLHHLTHPELAVLCGCLARSSTGPGPQGTVVATTEETVRYSS